MWESARQRGTSWSLCPGVLPDSVEKAYPGRPIPPLTSSFEPAFLHYLSVLILMHRVENGNRNSGKSIQYLLLKTTFNNFH